MQKHYSTEAPAEFANMGIEDVIFLCEDFEAEARLDKAEREGRA